MKNIILKCFNENGNFIIEGFDPYHSHNENEQWLRELLFDEDGNAHVELIGAAEKFAKEHNCLYNSDIAKYIHCSNISTFTHGNYTDINFWR